MLHEHSIISAGQAAFPRAALAKFGGLAVAMRPRQWAKNLACLAGLIFSGRLFSAEALGGAALAFVGFSLAASGVYLINDVLDRDLDRRDIKKRARPIASGVVPVPWAIVAAMALLTSAIISALALPPVCAAILVTYIGLALLYSWRLKHRVLLDVMVIAAGFVLRVLYGVYAVAVWPTSWIVLCMFFLATFLAFAKRRSELNQGTAAHGYAQRPVLHKYDLHFLDLMLGMTATMAILCYSLYTVTGRPGNASLVVTVPLVAYGIIRYLLRVMIHGIGDEPESDIFADGNSLLIIAGWTIACASIIYLDIHLFER